VGDNVDVNEGEFEGETVEDTVEEVVGDAVGVLEGENVTLHVEVMDGVLVNELE
jgi:hypothetical protein